ncbi:MAG: NAD(P)/FAD-dependent oxidoreductase [Kofleriaceae bacterium]
MRIIVIGAGTSGLYAALVLARAGHDVVVVEKDAQPPEVAGDDLSTWHRRGTPQAHLPHGFVGRGRALLASRAPDVLRAVLDAGAVDFDLAACAPAGPSEPGDEELKILFARRPLLESALWRAAEREPTIELRARTTVTGVASGTVATDRGELRAELVIDASGRRSPVAKWLGTPAPLVEECGIVYYSRYYRLRAGAELPPSRWLWGPRAELPFALALVHLAERGIHSITIATPTFDAELKCLRESASFTALCRFLPAFAPWADAARFEPIGDVLAMGGIQNVLRERAHAPRVIAIGDALCHTNAAYGWGMSLGMDHATALADTLDEVRSLDDVGTAYHARVDPEARARWELSTQQDRTRVRAWRGEPPARDDQRAAAMRAVAPAAMVDPHVFRVVMKVSSLLASADVLLDAELQARARAALAKTPPPAPPAPPSRDDALAAILGASA